VQIALDASSDPVDQNTTHIPECYPKIASSVSSSPHTCFSDERAAKQFFEQKDYSICHTRRKGVRVTGLVLIMSSFPL